MPAQRRRIAFDTMPAVDYRKSTCQNSGYVLKYLQSLYSIDPAIKDINVGAMILRPDKHFERKPFDIFIRLRNKIILIVAY